MLASKFRMCELFGMDEPLSIRDLRLELGLTLDQFGEKVGLSSKGQLSLIERNGGPCSVRVAVAIETLSGGRIDASTLNDDVRLSRAAVHAAVDTIAGAASSPDKAGDNCPSDQSEAA